MKKTLKIVGIVISIPIILFLVAAIVLATIDLNDYRSNIEQLVEENTGRQLTVKGDLEKSFFPWLGVTIGSLSLSNAKGFKPAEFVSVEKIEVKIDTLSLLVLKPKINLIILKGLNLNLAKNEQGKTNWDDFSKPATADAQQTTPAKQDGVKVQAPSTAEQSAPLALINIAGIAIEDANVNWVDEQAGASHSVKHVNLSVTEIALNKPIALTLDFELASSDPKVNAKVKLATDKLDWNLESQRYAVTPLTINVDASGDGLPVSPLSARLRTVVAADLKKQTLDVSELKLDALDVALQAKASVVQFIDAPQYQSSVEIAKLNPRDLLNKLSIELPPTADNKVLGSLSLKTDIKGDTNQAKVSGLTLLLDDTNITGNAAVKNFAKPAISVALSLDKINLDRYLPPASDAAAEPAPAEKAATEPTAPQPLPIPVDLIRSLDVDASINAGKLIVKQLDIDEVVLNTQVKNSVATLKPLSLKVAGGLIRSDITLDVKSADPRYTVKQSIQKVQAAPLVTAVAGEDYISGVLELTAAVTSKGMMLDQVKKNLNGDLSFSFKDGSVKGINLGEIARKARAKVKGEDFKSGEAPLATDFAELKGSAVIVNGVVTNKDLSAKTPLLRVAGEGSVDLTRDYMDYLVTSYVVGTSKGQEGAELDELKGLPIPVRLKGTFDKLDYNVDYGPLLKAYKEKYKKEVKEKVEAKKQEIKEESKEKIEEKKEELKEKAKDKLKKLLKF